MLSVRSLLFFHTCLVAASPINLAGLLGDLPPKGPVFTTLPTTKIYDAFVEPTQLASPKETYQVTGTVNTKLDLYAGVGYPFATTIPTATKPLILLDIDITLDALFPPPTAKAMANIFEQPIGTEAPPPQIGSRDDHPERGVGLTDIGAGPISTNKFYANLFLGGQNQSVWTMPYGLQWKKGNADSWGMSVTHIEQSQFAFGDRNPAQYFISPLGISHFIFTAAELGESTALTSDSSTAFSINANLHERAGTEPKISFPMVQGQGLVSAIYNNAQPILETLVYFNSLNYVGELQASSPIYKYRVGLNDQSSWLVYVVPTGSSGQPPFELRSSTQIWGPQGFSGLIQIAKNNAGEAGERAYDAAAGGYATTATLSGNVDGTTGSYTLAWTNGGLQDKTLLMFALPHHVAAFDSATNAAKQDIRLQSFTKGQATAVLANKIAMVEENLPLDIDFSPGSGDDYTRLSNEAINLINEAGASELNQDIRAQSVLDSMYFSGKALAKFATIIYTLNDVSGDRQLAASGLARLKEVFDIFVQNRQPFPLVYDNRWKGIVSSASYVTGDNGVDFGNTLYNDHHFHYGYHVYTAAVIGYLDPDWLNQGTNKAWVNTLLRDYANPTPSDTRYAHVRSFDWFHGHSWAKGLFESADGKDQESSSEDTFASFGMKMWGRVIGDPNIEARGNLQLAVQRRSFNDYFLMQSDNKVQPERFIGNKATGILFENKIDHTTYFGANIEFIQGIHMIPISPATSYHRRANFIREEWDTYFSNGRVDSINSGWRGILMANYALIEPEEGYRFFAQSGFNQTWLDGGASRTWYLALTAALGGARATEVQADVQVDVDVQADVQAML